MLPLFARNGGNFIRVWMCGFNFPIDQQDHFNNIRYEASDAYYNPSAIARLDHFVGLCERLGIHAMLCMGQVPCMPTGRFSPGSRRPAAT